MSEKQSPKDCAFDPNPQFWNHMVHWEPWADHFKNHDGDTGLLAKMLGEAWVEIERLRKSCCETDKRHSMLLFAYIATVETGKPVEPNRLGLGGPGGAWGSVQTLNQWRKENKLNIKIWDAV